jgi:hypothetical protein
VQSVLGPAEQFTLFSSERGEAFDSSHLVHRQTSRIQRRKGKSDRVAKGGKGGWLAPWPRTERKVKRHRPVLDRVLYRAQVSQTALIP